MDAEIKEGLDAITKSIDTKIEEKSNESLATAKKTFEESNQSIIKSVEELETKLNDRIDNSELAIKASFKKSTTKSFKETIAGALEKSEKYKSFTEGNATAAKIEFKADMTTGTSFTGEVIPADRVPGYKYDPNRPTSVRDLLNQGTTTSDVIRFVQETGYTNGAAMTAEGAAAGQSDFTMEAKDSNVRKLTTYFRISDEMLSDTPQITSYLSSRAPAKLREVEDTQLLWGPGTGQNLEGIGTAAADFDGGGISGIANANQFDVLVAAKNQLNLLNYNPTAILMNPTDFNKILLLKDTTANYLKDQVYQGIQPSFNGTPVILNNAVIAGDYIIGDLSMGTQLWNRQSLTVEFFREDGNNVKEGFVTVKLTERIALTNYLPNAFVHGNFAADIITIG